MLRLDVNTEFPFDNQRFDTVLAMNLLEHVYEWGNCASEVFRVLKPGGVWHGVLPFLYQVHGDPNDYWRATPEALGIFLKRAGFAEVEIEILGVGKEHARAMTNHGFQSFRSLRLLSWLKAVIIDKKINRNQFAEKNSKFFLGLAFTARRPDTGMS